MKSIGNHTQRIEDALNEFILEGYIQKNNMICSRIKAPCKEVFELTRLVLWGIYARLN